MVLRHISPHFVGLFWRKTMSYGHGFTTFVAKNRYDFTTYMTQDSSIHTVPTATNYIVGLLRCRRPLSPLRGQGDGHTIASSIRND
jgi:hypothetical protein